MASTADVPLPGHDAPVIDASVPLAYELRDDPCVAPQRASEQDPDGSSVRAWHAFVPQHHLLVWVLPVDYSDLTLLELKHGVGFVEQSPMGSMRLWRHERSIKPLPVGCVVTDALSFERRFAKAISAWVVRQLFRHRHAVLRSKLGVLPA